ncbi:MAG: hypothetical protein ACJ8DS_00415, partial [Microvirga sp.]
MNTAKGAERPTRPIAQMNARRSPVRCGAYATFAGCSLIELAKLRPLDLAALRLVHGVGVILTREAGEEDHVRTRRRRRSAPEPARLDLRSSP